MSELSNKLVQIEPPFSLKGLEDTEKFKIRPLPPMTIFASANRFLRFGFPPQRNYELYLHIIGKALQWPHFSSISLRSLPLNTLEILTSLILQESINAVYANNQDNVNSGIDIALSLANALEEIYQYDINALVAEDMVVLASGQADGLHGYFLKPAQNRDHMGYILEQHGYRFDLMSIPSINTYANYWLCRRLTNVLPWNTILKLFNDDRNEIFPYLYRFLKIRNHIKEHLDDNTDYSATGEIALLVKKMENWIRQEFTLFSCEAHVASPVTELVLVEGSTEELLIPVNAEVLGHNLNREGILVQPVGGKNQMLSHYVDYAEHMAVPISIVLDKDASSLLPDLNYYKRESDHVYILEEGEFEDIYAAELIVKTVNDYYQPSHSLTLHELDKLYKENGSRVKTLEKLFHNFGLAVFNKVEFAHRMAQTLKQTKQVAPPMRNLIEKIIESKNNEFLSFFT